MGVARLLQAASLAIVSRLCCHHLLLSSSIMPYCVKQYLQRDDYKEKHQLISSASIENSSFTLHLLCKRRENGFPSSLSNLLPSPLQHQQNTTQEPHQPLEDKYKLLLASSGRTFKLYSSKNKIKAETALQCVSAALEVLGQCLDDCISLELLSLLILPYPKTRQELPQLISQYAVKLTPTVQFKLAQLYINNYPILYILCHLTNMKILRNLRGGGIKADVYHPVTGATLVHMATLLGDERLSETLNYLNTTLSRQKFFEYINKSCREEPLGDMTINNTLETVASTDKVRTFQYL